jgi:hypothetical protein
VTKKQPAAPPPAPEWHRYLDRAMVARLTRHSNHGYDGRQHRAGLGGDDEKPERETDDQQ